MIQRGAALLTGIKAELKDRCRYLLLGLLLVALTAITTALYKSYSSQTSLGLQKTLAPHVPPATPEVLEQCLDRYQQKRAAAALEVVHFAGVKVAAHVGEPRGEQLWACTAVLQMLRTISSSCLGQRQGQGQDRCVFLELGGPGLCAFEVAKQMPRVSVSLLPSSKRLANLSRGLNGEVRNLRLIDVDELGSTDGIGGGRSGGSVLEGVLQSLSEGPVDTEGLEGDGKGTAGPYVVIQVNLHHMHHTHSSIELEFVRILLMRGVVHAAVVMLPTGGGGGGGAPGNGAVDDDGSGTMAASAAARQRAGEIVSTAVAVNLKAFWGGFDGLPISIQDLREGRWPTAVEATGAPTPVPQLAALTGVFLASSRAPPPTVHVLAPLRLTNLESRNWLLPPLCHFLLDTAAASNLTVNVVGLTLNGSEFAHNNIKSQKLPVLLHTIKAVAPSDIVVAIDSLDTLVQAPEAVLLDAYLRMGAPVMSVSTETNCWPPQFGPWCRFYPTPTTAVIHREQQQPEQQRRRQKRMLLEEEPQLGGKVAGEMVEEKVMLPNKFVNSGCFMGRAVVVAKYLQDTVDQLHGQVHASSWFPDNCRCLDQDDQGLLACAHLFGGNPYGMALDYRADFFYSIHAAREYLDPRPIRGRWVYNLTSTMPVIMHGNGDGKGWLEDGRRLIVGSDAQSADVGYEFLVDGKRTRYGDFCPPALAPEGSSG